MVKETKMFKIVRLVERTYKNNLLTCQNGDLRQGKKRERLSLLSLIETDIIR